MSFGAGELSGLYRGESGGEYDRRKRELMRKVGNEKGECVCGGLIVAAKVGWRYAAIFRLCLDASDKAVGWPSSGGVKAFVP